MKKAIFAVLATLTLVVVALLSLPAHGQQASSYVAGRRIAQNFAYGFGQVPGAHVAVGNSATGAGTVTVCPAVRALPDGRVINLFQNGILNPVTFDLGTASSETVTPTAVSVVSPAGLTVEADQNCAAITATFSFTHAPSQFTSQVRSGTYGLQEAINDAAPTGGIVTVDNSWQGTSAIIAAAIPYVGVSVEDLRQNAPQYWNAVPSVATTYLSAPAVLTTSTVGFGLNGANTTGGTYTGTSTYYVCVAYVDIAGQEGACSTTFSSMTAGTGSTNQIGFSAPVASTGAVGYTIYISLASGSYSLAYQVPLSSTICKLTLVESVTPACAVTNTTYNQTGSNAVVSALTVSTSPVDMQLGGVSGTLLTGNPNGRTAYAYAPSSHIASYGMPTVAMPFTVGGIGSATPISIGTVNLPATEFNYVGRRWRVCGRYQNTDVNSVKQNINIYWDAALSNVAGSPVQIGALQAGAGPGTAAAYTGVFCEEFTTTTSGAGATAAVQPGMNFLNYFLSGTPAVNMLGGDTNSAPVTTINLAGGGGFSTRLSIVHTNTTGNATPQLMSLTIEVL